ncbi:MAG TPA: TlpA disulfide reductase family protein [Candidatus Acidoferrales bacterium]|nr:TlpA disulfide reductase family protein [Candidatus Acidoferrales bacterium]
MNPLSSAAPGVTSRGSPRVGFTLLFAAAALSLLPSRLAAQQPRTKAPTASPLADPRVIDGQGFREILAKHRGKPLMVNFWATWCEPCRSEYPIVVELSRQYAPRGLVVIGISLDEDAEIDLVRHFLAKYRPGFTNYRLRPGNEEAFIHAVNPNWNGAIPATFFYSRDGHERMHLIGEQSPKGFESAIRALFETGENAATKSASPSP